MKNLFSQLENWFAHIQVRIYLFQLNEFLSYDDWAGLGFGDYVTRSRTRINISQLSRNVCSNRDEAGGERIALFIRA